MMHLYKLVKYVFSKYKKFHNQLLTGYNSSVNVIWKPDQKKTHTKKPGVILISKNKN